MDDLQDLQDESDLHEARKILEHPDRYMEYLWLWAGQVALKELDRKAELWGN